MKTIILLMLSYLVIVSSAFADPITLGFDTYYPGGPPIPAGTLTKYGVAVAGPSFVSPSGTFPIFITDIAFEPTPTYPDGAVIKPIPPVNGTHNVIVGEINKNTLEFDFLRSGTGLIYFGLKYALGSTTALTSGFATLDSWDASGAELAPVTGPQVVASGGVYRGAVNIYTPDRPIYSAEVTFSSSSPLTTDFAVYELEYIQPQPVPEPSTIVLIACGLLGILALTAKGLVPLRSKDA